MDKINQQKLEELNNKYVKEKVEEAIKLCKPAKVTVMTDAKEDIAYLRSLSINNEEEKKLKMEGHTIHFDGYYDQGRDKPHTKYLLSKDVDWGLGVNYIEKDEGLKEIYSFLDGSMAGKEMLVKFFSLGPINSIFSLKALQITDSAYVAHSEDLLYRQGYEEFKKLVAIIRLAVPYTGIILSTRESKELRDELLDLGISQVSAGSSTSPGGYKNHGQEEADQFYTNDNRTLDEVVDSICNSGYVPSFCTACYRVGRTGEDFMYLAKDGKMRNICAVNALMTLKEYIVEYASFETKKDAEKVINKLLLEIDDDKLKEEVYQRLRKIQEGKRDLYF